MEKVCLALLFALQKLKHYLGEHEIHLISRADHLKYILSTPVLTGRLARWTVILYQFNIEYVPQKVVKGQALAYFLAAHPVPDDSPLVLDLPDEEVMQTEIKKGWEIYFDGASRSPDGEKQHDLKNNQSSIGIIFVTPEGGIILHSFFLTEGCSNNEAEYEAIIAGLELSLEVSIDDLTIYGDSELIIKQLKGVNDRADALASLAASLGLSKNEEMTITVGARRILQPYDKVSVDVQTDEALTTSERVAGQDNQLDWCQPFMEYLQHGRLPDDRAKRVEVRRRSVQFVMWKNTLYKRSMDGMLLKCIAKDEVEEVMKEVHSGTCGAHQSGPKLQMQIKCLGYYWPTMIANCIGFVKRCQACQFHGDFIHSPPEPLYFTACSWPFAAWEWMS
ncbi:hypothetical protein RJ640_006671 [Escallonia rubra]|uniref:RNase H type-1 domain-containing protein n=1 Tax=Escallonia rubra TaxID=112253 RepID=A0AA88UQP9_9ASTE|nr:hypothetical protein RJ640_006671 [Escallonia rubra]